MMWMYVDAWNGFMIYPKNYQHVFATVTCLRKHPEWKKGLACRQRHPLHEFMDVLGSPQLGTPGIMSKLMYSKLSWSQSSAGSQSVCVCVSVLQQTHTIETLLPFLAIFITSQCFGIPELFQSGQFRALTTFLCRLGCAVSRWFLLFKFKGLSGWIISFPTLTCSIDFNCMSFPLNQAGKRVGTSEQKDGYP